MREKITKRLIESIKPKPRPYEVRDTSLPGFILRVQPSGSMSYLCQYERGKRITISKSTVLTPVQARDEAKLILADVAKGIDPKKDRVKKENISFGQFLEREYEPWVVTNLKRGDEEVTRLKRKFKEFYNKDINDISPWLLDKWKSKRIKSGISPRTVNRDIASIKAAFTRALKWGFLLENQLTELSLCRVENELRIRYLTTNEEIRLRKAIKSRDICNRTKRTNANNWRSVRKYKLKPDLSELSFFDYLEPMIIISLNTGLRRGELLSMKWEDVNFNEKIITVRAKNAKSRKLRHIPLNSEAYEILSSWKTTKKSRQEYVFINRDGNPLGSVKKAWKTLLIKAQIKNFRWHDMRHSFASKLVMAGVDLNTVRELLGHSDLQMTLRYAHLAPEHKAKAVAKLDSRTFK
jgi:integrase